MKQLDILWKDLSKRSKNIKKKKKKKKKKKSFSNFFRKTLRSNLNTVIEKLKLYAKLLINELVTHTETRNSISDIISTMQCNSVNN